MLVLMTTQEYPPETGWGGIGTYAATIAPALVRAGAAVHLLSVVDGQRRSSTIRDGVHLHRAPLRRPRGVGRALRAPQTWSRVSLAAAVAWEARRLGLDFDVCESPEWNAEGLFLSARRRLPMVVRMHSGARELLRYGRRPGWDARGAMRLEEALIRRADVVTSTRALTEVQIPRLGLDPGRVRTITYPVAPVEPLPPPRDTGRIMFAGRFEPRKGADVLVRAMPALLEREPRATVVLVGVDTAGTAGRSNLESIRLLADRLGVGSSLEVVERWGRDAVAEEMAKAAICAVPSRWESFGYVAAEAGALGRPVVASRIPALEDVVVDGHTGLLVTPDDPGALAAALAQLVGAPDRARSMGAHAAAEIARRSNPDHVAASTLEAYELAATVVGGSSRRR